MRRVISSLLLLLAYLMTASYTASNRTNELTIMGPSELNKDAVESFLRCVNGTEYKLYVGEGGEVVVILAQQRQIDPTGIDEKLSKCMIRHYDQLNIMGQSTVYPDEQHDSAVPLAQVTYESWLAGQGALGQQPIGTKPPASTDWYMGSDLGGGDSGPEL